MPVYTFKNTQTEEIVEIKLSMSEYDEYKHQHPHMERYFESGEAPSVGDPVRLGLRKPDAGFRDRLKEIQKAHPRGRINTW